MAFCISPRYLATRDIFLNHQTAPDLAISPRLLSDLRSRIAKCTTWGLTPSQVSEVASIMKVVASEWRDLVAGGEGGISDGKGDGLAEA